MKVVIPKRIKQKTVYFKQYTLVDLGIAILPLMYIIKCYKSIGNWKLVSFLASPFIIIIIWLLIPSGNGTKRNYEVIPKMWGHVVSYFKGEEDFVPSSKKLKKDIIREEKYEFKKEQRKK